MGLRKKVNKSKAVKKSIRLKKGNKRLPIRKSKKFNEETYQNKKTLIENYSHMGI